MIKFAGVSIAFLVKASQITIFAIQPLGMLLEGKTLVISRMINTKLIDSADAICARTQGGVSLFCRMGALGETSKNARVYKRLPYLNWLYEITNGGKRCAQ